MDEQLKRDAHLLCEKIRQLTLELDNNIESFSTEKIIVGDPTITSYDKNEYILIPTEKKGIEVISNKELDFAESQGSYPTDKKIYSSPLVNKNNLLIHTQDGKILFFRLKSRDLFYCLDLNERKICD